MSDAIVYDAPDSRSTSVEGRNSEGRFEILDPKMLGVSEVYFALAIPTGLTAKDVIELHHGSKDGSAEKIRYSRTLPNRGSNIGHFADVDSARELLDSALASPVETDVEEQLRAAGFKPYLITGTGRRLYQRNVGSRSFDLSVSETEGVELTFQRASTWDSVFAVYADRTIVLPSFLSSRAAQVAVAIAAASLYEAKGRTGRIKRAKAA